MEKPPVLITLTAPTCAGKSFLFSYIRDVAKLPCLISTTTRSSRADEIDGTDYYFISEELSKQIESQNGFTELTIYNGIRYGITWEEWRSKLQPGKIAFLIIEPTGLEKYVNHALETGALWLKYYIHTDPEIRYERFKGRAARDIAAAAKLNDIQAIQKVTVSLMNRLRSMLTSEMQWGSAASWDRTLFGDVPPEQNLEIIMNDVKVALTRHREITEIKLRHARREEATH